MAGALAALIGNYVMGLPVIHTDDTTIRVLAPGHGKTRTARFWVYAADPRSWSGVGPPAAFYRYSPDRDGERPREHLARFSGFLHADAYAGYGALYRSQGNQPPRVTHVACFAHARRKFFEVYDATKSPIAEEAIRRIAKLYEIEAEISGKSAEIRLAARQTSSQPLLDAFKTWANEQCRRVSGKTALGKALRYALRRWEALTCFATDGRLSIDNNLSERLLRGVAMAGSLCTPSSSAWKHWKRFGIGRAARARLPGDRAHNRFRREVIGADLVGRSGNNLLSGKDAGFNKAAYCMVCDAQQLCRLAHGKPCAVFFRRSICVDPTHASH